MKIVVLTTFLLLSAGVFSWIDPAWQYRAPITVNNNGSALSDYQVAVNTTSLVYNNTGLVGSWHFSEGSGTRAADSSGFGRDGTLISSPSWIAGRFGNGLRFNGNSVALGTLDISAQGAPFSVFMWVRTTQVGVANDDSIFFSKRTGSNTFSFDLEGSAIRVSNWCGSYPACSLTGSRTVNDGAWHHIGFAWDGATVSLYVDGAFDAAKALSFFTQSISNGNSLGAFDSGTTRPYVGDMDEVRAYNRTLPLSEIAALYNASKLRPDYADLRFSQPYSVYETPITLSGTGTSLADYQVSVNITNPTILPHMRPDGADLRFFAAQTSSPYSQTGLPYWIESINSTLAKVWVKANVSSGGSTIYLYYGNPNATGASNMTAVFRTATGGSISYNGNYTVHTFSSSGIFTPFFTGDVNITVIGGGGSGSGSYVSGCGCVGPGGGSGGVNVGSVSLSSTSPVAVTVGAGGIGTGVACSVNPPGTTGGTSSFGTYMVATGGPGGGTGAPLGSPGGFAGGSAIGCLSHGEVGPGGGGTAGAGGSNYGGAGGGGNGYGGAGGYQSAGGFAGGGGSSGWSGVAGQNGANGIVVVTYTNRLIASPEPSATLGSESVKSAGNEALLNYWLESDNRAWVKVPYVPNGTSTVYAYYGNPPAAAGSSANATWSVGGTGSAIPGCVLGQPCVVYSNQTISASGTYRHPYVRVLPGVTLAISGDNVIAYLEIADRLDVEGAIASSAGGGGCSSNGGSYWGTGSGGNAGYGGCSGCSRGCSGGGSYGGGGSVASIPCSSGFFGGSYGGGGTTCNGGCGAGRGAFLSVKNPKIIRIAQGASIVAQGTNGPGGCEGGGGGGALLQASSGMLVNYGTVYATGGSGTCWGGGGGALAYLNYSSRGGTGVVNASGGTGSGGGAVATIVLPNGTTSQGGACSGATGSVQQAFSSASPEPTALAGAEQTRGYNVLVRRCGIRQPGTNVTAYRPPGNVSASCSADPNGICRLEIGAGTYDLRLTFAGNSTAWKNATVFS